MTPTQEIANMQEYIRLHHAHAADFSALPERTMNGLFNQLSPEARALVKQNRDFVQDFRDSGGRSAPFQPKRYLDDSQFPEHISAAVAKSDGEDVVRGIHERMGTPTNDTPDNSAPDMRETLSAAFTEHEGAEHD